VAREGSEWVVHGEPKAAAERKLTEAVEDKARVQEGEIDRAGEH
jgi:hypothetical protein